MKRVRKRALWKEQGGKCCVKGNWRCCPNRCMCNPDNPGVPGDLAEGAAEFIDARNKWNREEWERRASQTTYDPATNTFTTTPNDSKPKPRPKPPKSCPRAYLTTRTITGAGKRSRRSQENEDSGEIKRRCQLENNMRELLEASSEEAKRLKRALKTTSGEKPEGEGQVEEAINKLREAMTITTEGNTRKVIIGEPQTQQPAREEPRRKVILKDETAEKLKFIKEVQEEIEELRTELKRVHQATAEKLSKNKKRRKDTADGLMMKLFETHDEGAVNQQESNPKQNHSNASQAEKTKKKKEKEE